MGATNTCVIYEKLQKSHNVLLTIENKSYIVEHNLSNLEETMNLISKEHDNALKTPIAFLEQTSQKIKNGYENVSMLALNLVYAINSYNEAEGKVNEGEFAKFIQKSDLIDANTKIKIQENGFNTYYSEEGYKKKLTEEELEILKNKKVYIEKITNSTVSENVLTNDLVSSVLDPKTVTTTLATSTALLMTPNKYLSQLTGPYSESGLKAELKKAYPLLTDDQINIVVQNHLDKNNSPTKEKMKETDEVKKKTIETDEGKDDIIRTTTELNYRKSSGYSSNKTSSSSGSTGYSQSGGSSGHSTGSSTQTETNIGSDNQQQPQDIKDNFTDKLENNTPPEKPQINEVIKTEDTQIKNEATDVVERQPSTENNSKPNQTFTAGTNSFSNIAKNLTTSVKGDVLEPTESDSLTGVITDNTDNTLSYIPKDNNYDRTPIPSDPIKANNSPKSSGIAPVAIGLGLAGTTSVAANKIIQKKEDKQLNKINGFEVGTDKEERRFIPKDLPEPEEESASEESSSSNEQTEEIDWYKYIKELY